MKFLIEVQSSKIGTNQNLELGDNNKTKIFDSRTYRNKSKIIDL
jgi:hypothetical protein